MGRNNGKKPRNIRGMIRGIKNRWGRFQCPRDGSICKSLEAWHWHRIKYHPTEHINYVEHGNDEDEVFGDREGNNRKSPSPPAIPSVVSFYGLPSSRLLPPEAFAPLRPQSVEFPDDISDLTEPEIPIILSEEMMNEAPPGDTVTEHLPEVASKETEAKMDRQETHWQELTSNSRSQEPTCESRDQESPRVSCDRKRLPEKPSGYSDARSHGNDCYINFPEENDRALSSERTLSECSQGHEPPGHEPPHVLPISSSLKLVSLFVMEILECRKKSTVDDILPEVQSRFTRLGLTREALVGVVTGTLMGAMDQWRHGYDAGWRDGASEVLRAPLLRSVALKRRSQDGLLSPETTDCDPHEMAGVEPSQPCRGSLSSDHGTKEAEDKVSEGRMPRTTTVNFRRNSTEHLETPSEQSRKYSTGAHHHSDDINNNNQL